MYILPVPEEEAVTKMPGGSPADSSTSNDGIRLIAGTYQRV
jgi:hypothetical protein